jgi:hypothetical protein
MVFNHLFPVFSMLLLGHLLKRTSLTDDAFLKTADGLVYYIFFPALLFWKIGSAPPALLKETGLYKAAILSVLVIYLLSTLYIILFKVRDFQAGSFSQSCYRFNTYIGVAIVFSALGEEGLRQFGLLIAIIIPIINVLAVTTLTWFSEKRVSLRARLVVTSRALISNPLILACLSGIIYAKLINGFPEFIDNTLRLASYVTLPLALISIGAALSLKGLQAHFKLAAVAAGFKILLLPAVGYLFLNAFEVSGVPFKVGMVFFMLPTSTALYVLSSLLHSDTELASAAIALSTLLSIFSLSIALLL